LADFLENVRATGPDKARTLGAVLERAAVSPLVATFARYVLEKRRLRLLPDIRAQFHRLADERLGRAQASVTVAAPLAKEQEAELKRKLEGISGKTITLNVTVDPAILGGAVTRIGSTVWDGSLRHQFNRIRESIVKG
jgi:F-type H+-transporting ATPase subunit delta